MALVTDGRKSTVEPLLRAISDAWQVGEDGELTSKSRDIFNFESAIVRLLNFSGSGLGPSAFERCAISAVRSVVKGGSPTIEALELAYQLEKARFDRQRRKAFYAVTRCHFSVGQLDFWLPLEIWGYKAVLSSREPQFCNPEPFFVNAYGDVDPARPAYGAYLTIGPFKARDEIEAFELCNRHVRTVLGFVAYHLNVNTSRRYIGHQRPLTPILPGKEYILYDSEWKRFDLTVMYNPVVVSSANSITPGEFNRLREMNKYFSWLSKLDKPRAAYAREFLKLYYDAVTEITAEDQLIRLWKAAEYLTFSQGASSKQISRRLSLSWTDRGATYALCEAAGHRRNEIIHSEIEGLPIESVVESFRDILEELFRRSLTRNVKNLKAWKAALEIASVTEDENFEDVREALRVFGWYSTEAKVET